MKARVAYIIGVATGALLMALIARHESQREQQIPERTAKAIQQCAADLAESTRIINECTEFMRASREAATARGSSL